MVMKDTLELPVSAALSSVVLSQQNRAGHLPAGKAALHRCRYSAIFFHPDFTVGIGVSPIQSSRRGFEQESRAVTAGQELPHNVRLTLP